MLTTAPGKVMIAGEYSVLLGFPALVAAVDVVASCRFIAGPVFRFFTKTAGDFIEDSRSTLFLAVITTFKNHSIELSIGEYYLDTSEFFDSSGQKIGLGSSAAAVTALARMLHAQNGINDQALLFQHAQEAHRLFSGGVGSGADIAASVYGGVILYQQTKTAPLVNSLDLSIIWPNILIIHTRKPQSTTQFVEKFLDFKTQKAIIDNFNAEQTKSVEQILTNLGDINVLIQAINQLYSLLDTLGTTIGIDIVSTKHRRIASIAKSSGGAAKPSGAGGGDIAVALIPEARQLEFCIRIEQCGFLVLAARLNRNT